MQSFGRYVNVKEIIIVNVDYNYFNYYTVDLNINNVSQVWKNNWKPSKWSIPKLFNLRECRSSLNNSNDILMLWFLKFNSDTSVELLTAGICTFMINMFLSLGWKFLTTGSNFSSDIWAS